MSNTPSSDQANLLFALLREMGHLRGVAGRRSQLAGAVCLAIALAGCGSSGAPSQETGTSETGTRPLAVASPDLQNGGVITKRFTCDGGGARPSLSWAGVPAKAVEVAIL